LIFKDRVRPRVEAYPAAVVARLIQFLLLSRRFFWMTKASTAEIQGKGAERQLFDARRTLAHLVEMYDNGKWRVHYKEPAFADALQQAKRTIAHWSAIIRKGELG
jgi:hypothetical protein